MSIEYLRHEALTSLAYQSWLDRGQPIGSPEIDWTIAEQKLAAQEALDLAFAHEKLPEYSLASLEACLPATTITQAGGEPGRQFLGTATARI